MKYILAFILIFSFITGEAQNPIRGVGDRLRNIKNAGDGNDSLGKRNKFEDSITISFRYLDTLRNYKIDSSIDDFSKRFPIPATNYYLGNSGNASQSYLFSPIMKSGWDAGFHAYDIYKFTIDKARFFTTTRPYSEINYMLASRAEQFIELMHTQNIRPNWNVHLQYRFLNAPGFFKNQKSSHNNYLVTSWVQSINKRYNNYVIVMANNLKNSENGGIQDTANFIDNELYTDRFRIPTKLGGSTEYGTDFFNTKIYTGLNYTDFNALMRQQYDFGKKDSLVTDSTVVPLFFPRLRLEHTIRYSKYSYSFFDENTQNDYYSTYYGLDLGDTTQFSIQDDWKELMNDFSIYTFPDAKNTQQFIKAGAGMQNLSGTLKNGEKNTYTNIFAHGEYRNRTRNQKWDLQASGKFYFTGYNSGDYEAAASIQSLLGKKIGSIQLGFENVNREPSYKTNITSNFYLMTDTVSLKKENSTHLYANIYQPLLKLGLSGHYYLLTNYTYYTNYYTIQQYNSLFNVLQIAANKVFAFGKHDQWKWRADVYLQQVIGNGPINVPLIYTRQRFAYEGNLGYRNLTLAAGIEARYHTNYKADNYSPLLGQFFYQNDSTIKYKLPDIAAFINFRIKSFKVFTRIENLNTFRDLGNNNWGFTNNNFAAPNYPYPGLIFRLGIFWGFVN